MSENISVTRIIDLPEGLGSSSFISNGGISKEPNGFSNTYLPMDIHPNPYGMPPPPPGGILPPEHTLGRSEKNPQQGQSIQSTQYIPEVQQRLPQRDIPMNQTDHIQDEQIQQNYIPPPPKLTTDYIKEYQVSQDRQIREYEEKKMREKMREHWLDKLQLPILIGLIYFVFQLPIVHTLVFRRFSFLLIYNDDGNFNLFGLSLKSTLFALVYMLIKKSIEFFE